MSRFTAHQAAQVTSFAAVLLVAGAGGFWAYRFLFAHPPTITVAPVVASSHAPTGIAGTSAQPAAPAAAAHKIPDWLPDVAMRDSTGTPRRLSEWKGRLLVVNFWATWCEPCQREIPLLARLHRERAAQGFEVVGIAVDLRAAVLKYAHHARIDYPVLVGEQDGLAAVTALGMDTVFPFTVFADREGRIITLKIGELRPREASFILDRMHELDQGRLELAAARVQIASGIAAMAAQQAR